MEFWSVMVTIGGFGYSLLQEEAGSWKSYQLSLMVIFRMEDGEMFLSIESE